ncbi:hypothetical protein DSL64_03805 [Dyadobacter luteus]|uniref:Uncharacterized protein n=1 Tax=Dyadobacter luteus TaxID=2259619 RepID=A0A3D8YFU8_9BACT|nr:hypothetical protein DSL64_03805 [Dyadobacter luteus]
MSRSIIRIFLEVILKHPESGPLAYSDGLDADAAICIIKEGAKCELGNSLFFISLGYADYQYQ